MLLGYKKIYCFRILIVCFQGFPVMTYAYITPLWQFNIHICMSSSFFGDIPLWMGFHYMIELLHAMPITRNACYRGHQTYDMNQCYFIWYGITNGLYFMTHWGCIHVCICAYVCHMTHGIKGWQKFKFTYSSTSFQQGP